MIKGTPGSKAYCFVRVDDKLDMRNWYMELVSVKVICSHEDRCIVRALEGRCKGAEMPGSYDNLYGTPEEAYKGFQRVIRQAWQKYQRSHRKTGDNR